MRKISVLLLSLTLSSLAPVQAQTFLPPAVAEIISVPHTAGVVSRIQHTSCYTAANVSFAGTANNLYLYSWNAPWAGGSGIVAAGIGWCRRNTTDATVINQGFLPLNSDIADLEVGFMSVRSDIYVIATYYKFSTGQHILDIYLWNNTSLVPFNMGNILSTSTYGRISLDIHELSTAAITWNDAAGLHVKIISSPGGVLTIGNSILITNVPANSVIPDVAFAHATSIFVRIAFVNADNGDIHVMRKDLSTLLTAGLSTTFLTDDINAAAYPLVTPIQFESTPNNLNLDCPDHYTTDNWSYVYAPISSSIRARIKTVSFSASAFTVLLNTGLTGVSNFNPTIAYDRTGQTINYGWYTDYGNRGYVAVERTENGNFVTPSGTYRVVSNYTGFLPGITTSTPVLAFSKQNDNSSKLFAVYPILPSNTSLIDLRTKLVSWTATTFNAVIPGNANLFAKNENVSVAPNPFISKIALDVPADNGQFTYAVNITDISGRTVKQFEGDIHSVNGKLDLWADDATKGFYLLNVTFNTDGNTRSFKIVKQ
jgi:hypothetical protein